MSRFGATAFFLAVSTVVGVLHRGLERGPDVDWYQAAAQADAIDLKGTAQDAARAIQDAIYRAHKHVTSQVSEKAGKLAEVAATAKDNLVKAGDDVAQRLSSKTDKLTDKALTTRDEVIQKLAEETDLVKSSKANEFTMKAKTDVNLKKQMNHFVNWAELEGHVEDNGEVSLGRKVAHANLQGSHVSEDQAAAVEKQEHKSTAEQERKMTSKEKSVLKTLTNAEGMLDKLQYTFDAELEGLNATLELEARKAEEHRGHASRWGSMNPPTTEARRTQDTESPNATPTRTNNTAKKENQIAEAAKKDNQIAEAQNTTKTQDTKSPNAAPRRRRRAAKMHEASTVTAEIVDNPISEAVREEQAMLAEKVKSAGYLESINDVSSKIHRKKEESHEVVPVVAQEDKSES